MADYKQYLYEEDLQFDDDDAKADELPQDEYEGDASTGNMMNSPPSLPPHISSSNQYHSHSIPSQKSHGPKPVPPVSPSNNSNPTHPPFPMNSSQSLSPKQSATDFVYSPVDDHEDTTNIMAFGANYTANIMKMVPQSSMPDIPPNQSNLHSHSNGHQKSSRHSQHRHSKTMPMLLPQFWTCSICTFAENTVDAPMCLICGALPPLDNNPKSKISMKSVEPQNQRSNSPETPDHSSIPFNALNAFNFNDHQSVPPNGSNIRSNPMQQMNPMNASNPFHHINAVMQHHQSASNLNNNNNMNQQNRQHRGRSGSANIQSAHRSVMSDMIEDAVLSPRAHEPDHHQHRMWQVQQTRFRHNDHGQNHSNTHHRALSDQQIISNQISAASQLLPNFLVEDDQKVSNRSS